MCFLCSAGLAQTAPAPGPTPTKSKAATQKSAAAAGAAQKPASTTSQKPAEKSEAAKEPAASPVNVPPETVVATITGICSTGQQSPCVTKLTRAEFDRLVAALNPSLPIAQRRELAASYVQVLALVNEGRKMGLDKDPVVQEKERLQSLEAMARATAENIQTSYKPTDQEIETYYTENSSRFEEMALRLVVIPKSGGEGMKPEERKAYADKMRERVVAGEDTDKLEAEVFVTTKAPGAPPSTAIGWKRRGTLPRQFESEITSLKAGQASQVIEDGQNYYIVKVDSKRMAPLAAERSSIEKAIQSEHVDEKMQQIRNSVNVKLDERYFGPPPQPQGPATGAGPPARPSRPVEGQADADKQKPPAKSEPAKEEKPK